MNYIAEINAFWHLAGTNPLSTGQVALWFSLMNINNKVGWTEWFTVPNQVLSISTGLSRGGILKARNVLKQRGFIDLRERGTKATAYKMYSITALQGGGTMANSVQASEQEPAVIANSEQVSVQDGVQNSVQDGVQVSVQISDTLNKPNVNINQTKQAGTYVDAHEADLLCRYFEDSCGQAGTAALLEEIRKSLRGGMSSEVIRAAIDETAGSGAEKPAPYAAKVLRNLRLEGVRTLADLQNRQERHRTKGGTRNGTPELQRAYDAGDLHVTRL